MSNSSRLQYPNSKQYILTIPKNLVLLMRWKEKDIISFSMDGKAVHLDRQAEKSGVFSVLQYPQRRQYLLTIPKTLVELKGWKKSEKIIFMLDEDGRLMIKGCRNEQ
ncbi:hypothetical protein JW968_01675 [Candidatus Woesearchaeota archaeon]|nr:hypothetical protein [Candidatus Woesearchaeota archaeon]